MNIAAAAAAAAAADAAAADDDDDDVIRRWNFVRILLPTAFLLECAAM